MVIEKLEIKLPVENPWITTYPIFANPLSILQLYKKTYPWILNSFNQLVCNGNEALSFYDFNYRTCPFLTVQRIKKTIISKISSNIIDLFKILLQEKNYIYLVVNTKYINVYNNKTNYRHDLFIYGYNDLRGVFYIADNYLAGKYHYGECTYNELLNSILFLEEKYEGYLGFNGCIEYISFNDDEYYNKYYYDLNTIRLRDSLKAYMGGKCIDLWSIQEYRVAKYGEKKFKFGVDCYQFIHEKIDQVSQHYVFMPSFYIIYDHKKHLLRIMKYLDKHKIIDCNKHIKVFEEISNKALKCINLILKYSLTNDNTLLKRLHLYYNEIQFSEEDSLSKIINILDSQ